MKKYTLTGWQDYWKIFDELIDQLTSDNKTELVNELKDAQKQANGLTDGWHGFKFAFKRSIKSNRQIMTDEQTQIAEFLIKTLDKTLTIT